MLDLAERTPTGAVTARLFAAKRVRTALGLLVVLLVAGALRTAHLKDQPVFIDEDLYTVAVLRLDNLSPRSIGRMAAQVTKPPLPLLTQAVLTPAIGDALLAGRLQSAISGLVTTLLTFSLGRRLGGGRASAGLLSALVYALSPVAVLHERMVLPDGLLNAAALAAALVGWSAVERADPRRAALAAVLGFLAVQMKVPGVATVAAPALAALALANLPLDRRRVMIAVIAAAGPLLSYAALRISPLGPYLGAQDEARLGLLTSLVTNVGVLWDAVRTYVPAGVGALIALGIVRVARVKRSYLVFVLGMLGAWVVPWLFISNFAPSRYYLPAVPYLAALAGVGGAWLIDSVALPFLTLPAVPYPAALAGASGARFINGVPGHRRSSTALASLGVMVALTASGILALGVAIDLSTAQLSALDDWQYRTGWASGAVYARAAALMHRAQTGDGRVYMISGQHLMAAGVFDSPPDHTWVVINGGPLPRDAHGELVVMIDDIGMDAVGQLVDHAPGHYLDQLLQIAPGAQVLGFFPQADLQSGVALLRVQPHVAARAPDVDEPAR